MSRFARRRAPTRTPARSAFSSGRLLCVQVCVVLIFTAILVRLFYIQVLNHPHWEARAAAQHEREDVFPARRGMIALHDESAEGGIYPLAVTRDAFFLYAEPNAIDEPDRAATLIAPLVKKSEETLRAIFTKAHDPWEPIAHDVDAETAQSIRSLHLAGISAIPEPQRVYPEKGFASHIIGFVGSDARGTHGQYGIEGFEDALLAGTPTVLRGTTDVHGAFVGAVGGSSAASSNGADVLLTIDRRIQFAACTKLKEAVTRYGASGGTVIIVEPTTGFIRAMCSVPDFDPNAYGAVEDPSVFNNPAIFTAYEPGSIFKPIAMAAGIETNAVTPESTYVDTGSRTIGPHTIHNADRKSYGEQTMVGVLTRSLNTGMVHVAELVNPELLRSTVEQFGFGKRTGITLHTEVAGDVSSFRKEGLIFRATGAFGQGITVTPLQMAAAYGAIANGGVLMKPTIIAEVRRADGTLESSTPTPVHRVISARTAALISGMLVSVVEDGFDKKGAVPGYTLAGKTGTAQIARSDGPGYEEGAVHGSFVGFGPVPDPRFVVVIKLDRLPGNLYASGTAAPLFASLAEFLLQYYHIPPNIPSP